MTKIICLILYLIQTTNPRNKIRIKNKINISEYDADKKFHKTPT